MSALSTERMSSLLAERFAGRTDCFLLELPSGAMKAVEALTPAVIADHLLGKRRVGIYVHENRRASYLGFDFDGKAPKRKPQGIDAAWSQLQRVASVIDADLGLPCVVAEITRSGKGFAAYIFFDADDLPSVEEVKRFGLLVLEAAGLPTDEDEKAGHPGVYPHPPASEGSEGKTRFLPLCGVLNGAKYSRFVDLATRSPLVRQEAALEDAKLVTRERLLQATADLHAQRTEPGSQVEHHRLSGGFSVENWIARHLAGHELRGPKPWRDGRRWVFKTCPWNAAHGDRSAYVVEHASGAVSAGCHHNGCAGKSWSDLRALFEPAAKDTRATVEASVEPAVEQTALEEIPELPAECWRHGFREFRDAYGPTTEACDAFFWSGYLTLAALALGRRARLHLGQRIFPNVYVANVGASGRSRKTTAQDYARLMLAELDPSIIHSIGISSPEGLIELLCGNRDEKDRKLVSPIPSRVLIDLNETAILLRKGQAEATRGLPPLLTTAFDCPPSLRLPTRHNMLFAPQPFLCILTSSTAEWLRDSLTANDVRGGLGGRFIYMVGAEKAPIAWPPLPDEALAARALEVLHSARDRHDCERGYDLAPGARQRWTEWYLAERARAYPNGILECLAQRLHLHAWKTALVYAALEGTSEITDEQLAAACAFADYQRAAQEHVLGDLGTSEYQRTEDRAIGALTRHGPLATWELRQRVRHVETHVLERVLTTLQRLGVLEQRKDGRARKWCLVGKGQGFGKGFGKVLNSPGNGRKQGRRRERRREEERT